MDLINGMVSLNFISYCNGHEHTVVALEPVPAHCHVAENDVEFCGFTSLRETFSSRNDEHELKNNDLA